MRRRGSAAFGLSARAQLCVAWLSATAVVDSQDSSAPPYDASMPDSVGFPVNPEAILNETDELQHRPFASATYTYHAGVFDVHANDTERDGSTMISNGVFAFASLNQSMKIEQDFWRIVDGWESLATERWATPVLGIDHSRVFHTVSASGQRWPWRERLLDEELEDFRDLGFKQARLAFQWTEAEPNWEQMGLQYMYLEYLSEVKRLNSGINPRLLNYTNETHFDDLGVNDEYMIPTLFSSFVKIQGYNVNAVLDTSAMNSHSRPPGSIFPGINYTALAPELEANWKPDIRRGVYFQRLYRPIINDTVVNIQHVNTTNHTSELEANIVIGATSFATPWADGEPQTFYLPFPFTVTQLMESSYSTLSIPADIIVRLASTGTGDGVMREFASSASEVPHDEDSMLDAMNLTLPVPVDEDGNPIVEGAEAEGEGEGEAVVAAAVPEPEPENRTILTAELAGVCTCSGELPPGELCREYVPKACLEDESLPFCAVCVDTLIDSFEPNAACPDAISRWVASNCEYATLQWDDFPFGAGYEEASTDATCTGSQLLRSGLGNTDPGECAGIVRSEPGCGEHFVYGSGDCACVTNGAACNEAADGGHSTYRLTTIPSELPSAFSYMHSLPKPEWMNVW
jgi:hypothetical protein